MATPIVAHDTTSTLADAATAYLQQHTLTDATPAFIGRMVATLQHLITVQEDDDLEDRDFRYAMLVAADAEIDFDDVPPALWNEPTPLPDRMAAAAREAQLISYRMTPAELEALAEELMQDELCTEADAYIAAMSEFPRLFRYAEDWDVNALFAGNDDAGFLPF